MSAKTVPVAVSATRSKGRSATSQASSILPEPRLRYADQDWVVYRKRKRFGTGFVELVCQVFLVMQDGQFYNLYEPERGRTHNSVHIDDIAGRIPPPE